MKFLKFLVILLIPLLFCSAAYASDATDTSDNIAISQQNIDLDNAVYVPDGESISDINIDVENSVYVSENDYITSDGLKAGPQTDGPNPSVEFEADDPNNPVDFFINETFHGEIIFRNDGDAIGYQPFLEVVLPNEITDFKMFYLGNSVETIDLGVFSEENNYTILNPLTNKEVKGEAGQRLILAISPFGSYSSDIPPAADLVVDKEIVFSGNYSDEIIYTITVTNRGPNDATGVTVTDKLPDSLIFISSDNLNYNSANGVWTIGNLAVGDYVTLTITAKINGTGIIENEAVVSGNEYDHNLTNNDDSVTSDIPPVTDLVLDKTITTDEIVAGEYINYAITITNVGVDAALDVILHDSIPSILEDVEYRINNGDWQEFTGDIYLRTILGNSTVTVEIRGIVNSGYLGNITNFANVSTSTSETDYTNNNDTVTGEVTAITDLKVVKEANDLTVVAGDNISYTVTITNYGPSDAVNVELRDYFDTSDLLNMQYSLDNVHWYSYAPGSVIQVGTIVSGDGRVIYFKALVNGSTRGTILNTVNITTDTPNEGENSSSVTTDVVEEVTISIDKTANTTNADPGEFISYDIYIRVNGVSDVTNVVFTDILNSELLDTSRVIYFIDGVYQGRWTGSINLGTLHPGDVVFIHLANLNVKDTADSDIPNTAIVTSNEYPNGLKSDYDIHLNTADLAVDKDVLSGNYTDEIKYVITVTNNGPDDATSVVVNDKLPDGLIYTDYVADRGTYDPETGVWTIGDLANGETLTLTIIAKINITGNITNEADTTGDQYDPDVDNNEDDVTSEIPHSADLVVDKEVVSVGNYTDEIVYIITVTNNGPDDATGVNVSDILPEGLIFTGSNGTYNPNTGVWTIGDLANGESISIRITAKINITGNVTNKVNVTGNEHDSNLTNNNDTVTSEIPPAADLAVDKEVVSVGNYSDEIEYVITVTNNGPDDAVLMILRLAFGILVI